MAVALKEVPAHDPIFEEDRPFVTKEQVLAVSDRDTLAYWFECHDEQAFELKAFLTARRDAEIDDEDWFLRAAGRLAHINIGKNWIEKRMLSLGFEPPYSPTDPRSRMLTILNEKVVKLKNEVERLKSRLPEQA